MLAERSIRDACARTAVFNRARQIAARLDLLANRRCDYEPDYTQLRGQIQGAQWYETYDAHVEFDEGSGEIIGYGCTCQPPEADRPLCKHAAALALQFAQAPERFAGYEADYACSTSAGMLKYLDGQEAARAQAPILPAHASPAYEDRISIEATICEPDGYYARWQVGFAITDGETSYALRNVTDLLDACDARAFYSYGKKLAFVHDPACFTERARRVIGFIRRVVNTDPSWNRREHWDASTTHRNLYVSAFNVGELLSIYEGASVTWERAQAEEGDSQVKRVQAGDPHLALALRRYSDTAWEFSCEPRYQAIDCGVRFFLADEEAIWRCSDELAQCKGLLAQVLGPSAAASPPLVAERDIARFCAIALPQVKGVIDCEVPDELRALVPEPCTFEFYLDTQGRKCECAAKVRYGEAVLSLFGDEPVSVAAPNDGAVVASPLRDDATEAAVRAVVERLFPHLEPDGCACTMTDDDVFMLLDSGVDELMMWGEVFTTTSFDRLTRFSKPVITTGVSVRSGVLHMNVDAASIDAAQVAALLSSYRKKKRYHRLKNGAFVRLTDGMVREMGLDTFSEMADDLGLTLAQIRAGVMEVPAYHAFLLDARLDDSQKDEGFRRFVDHFEGAKGAGHPLDERLADVLRSYQREGFSWLCRLSDNGFGGILADEMGLGKSVQAIAYLAAHLNAAGSADSSTDALSEDHPALIVCPASLVYNWLAEFAKFAPAISACALSGTASERAALLAEGSACVYVISYDLVRIDVELLAQREYFAVILDEAQYIKNHATKTAQAVKALDARHRFALTGTPIENRLSELWSIFDFIMPGLLGSYQRFKGAYETPIVDGDFERAERLAAKVRPFILRRLKADVLTDLPEKSESIVRVRPSAEQQRVYEALEKNLALQLAKRTGDEVRTGKLQILAELTRLRRVCCDPRLVYEDFDAPSAKVLAIADLVQSAIDSEQKALVFSAFPSFLELIADELAACGWAYHVITGKTPASERVALVDSFNVDSVPVFLISLKAGGTGLNLVGASIVIHADPWWNAAAQNQATDRAHRIGQTRTVSVYQVVCADTVEERIIDLQETKRELTDRIIDAHDDLFARLSREQLLELLDDDDIGPQD